PTLRPPPLAGVPAVTGSGATLSSARSGWLISAAQQAGHGALASCPVGTGRVKLPVFFRFSSWPAASGGDSFCPYTANSRPRRLGAARRRSRWRCSQRLITARSVLRDPRRVQPTARSTISPSAARRGRHRLVWPHDPPG